jgi:hypothetical protein
MLRATILFICVACASAFAHPAFAPAPVVARSSAMRTRGLKMVSLTPDDLVFNQSLPENVRRFIYESKIEKLELENQLAIEKSSLENQLAIEKSSLENQLAIEKLENQLAIEKLKSSLENQLAIEKLKSSNESRALENQLAIEKLKSSEIATSLNNYLASTGAMSPRAIIGAYLFVSNHFNTLFLIIASQVLER